MLNFDDVKTVGIFGDWHSNSDFAVSILEKIKENGENVIIPDVFVHLGDFNFFPYNQGQKFLSTVNKELSDLDREMFVIDGNHEDFDFINSFKNSVKYEGFKDVPDAINANGFESKKRDHIFYIPRGLGWTWGGKKFVGVGGAHSIDYSWRTLGIDFFLEEDVTEQDVDKALENGSADYIFTHESVVNVPSPFNIYDQRTIIATNTNKYYLRNIISELDPKATFHGHHHKFYIDKFHNKVHSVGLGRDDFAFSENYVVLDVKNDEILFQFEKFGEVLKVG